MLDVIFHRFVHINCRSELYFISIFENSVFFTAASPQQVACRRKVAVAGTVSVNVDKVIFILLFSDRCVIL